MATLQYTTDCIAMFPFGIGRLLVEEQCRFEQCPHSLEGISIIPLRMESAFNGNACLGIIHPIMEGFVQVNFIYLAFIICRAN